MEELEEDYPDIVKLIYHKLYTEMIPIVDYCFRYCEKNAEAEKRRYVKTSLG
mgnify:CR=1 FL=1